MKILIHGQEMDTLAGHVDLTQMFIVNTKSPQSGQITTHFLHAPRSLRERLRDQHSFK
jgi:hypothetical protein